MIGGRPALLLLPGIVGDRAEMQLLADRLRHRWAVTLADLPCGAGGLRGLAQGIAGQMSPEPCAVVGASLGGLVGRQLLAVGDARVQQVVTIGARWGPSPRAGALRAAAVLAERAPPALFRRWYRARLGAALRAEGAPWGPSAALIAAAPSGAEWARRLRAIADWGLPAPDPRVFALWGADDHERTLAGPDGGGGAGLPLLPGGHRPHLTHPEVVAAAVERLLGAGGR